MIFKCDSKPDHMMITIQRDFEKERRLIEMFEAGQKLNITVKEAVSLLEYVKAEIASRSGRSMHIPGEVHFQILQELLVKLEEATK